MHHSCTHSQTHLQVCIKSMVCHSHTRSQAHLLVYNRSLVCHGQTHSQAHLLVYNRSLVCAIFIHTPRHTYLCTISHWYVSITIHTLRLTYLCTTPHWYVSYPYTPSGTPTCSRFWYWKYVVDCTCIHDCIRSLIRNSCTIN